MGVDVAIGRKAVGLVPFHAHVLVFFHWWEGNHKQWKSCTVVPSTVQHTQTKTTQHKDRHSPPFSSSIMESARGSIESSKMLSFAYCTCPSPPPISLPPFPKIFLFLCIKQDFPTSRLATIPPPPLLFLQSKKCRKWRLKETRSLLPCTLNRYNFPDRFSEIAKL